MIRGIGAFTAAGAGRKALFGDGSVLAGTPTESPKLRLARGDVEQTTALLPNRKILRLLSRGAHWGLVAAIAALEDAQAQRYSCAPHRLGVFAGGFCNFEELNHLHALLRAMRQNGQDWRAAFGGTAVTGLPPFMLLRRLPNAVFCHVAHVAEARGYNATLLNGPTSAIECLRRAAFAIRNGSIDAALVVAYDMPLSWELTYPLRLMLESTTVARPIVLSEGGIAFYVESSTLHPERSERPYARFECAAGAHARDGLTGMNGAMKPPETLGDAVRHATSRVVNGSGDRVAHLDLTGIGVPWWDDAEAEAVAFVPAAQAGSATGSTGYLGNASGGAGLARLCYLLRDSEVPAEGVVVRAAPTGQCVAARLATVDEEPSA